jgi:hypothetical protein
MIVTIEAGRGRGQGRCFRLVATTGGAYAPQILFRSTAVSVASSAVYFASLQLTKFQSQLWGKKKQKL